MYRIITSTTKEEHFESPTAAAYGMMMYCGNTAPNSAVINSGIDSSMANIKISPRIPVAPNGVPYGRTTSSYDSDDYYGDFDVYGDLYVHGNIHARNYSTESSVTIPKITMLPADPTTATWQGNIGDMAFSANYAYICVNTDNWARFKIERSW